ncbi:hypothetical protein AAZX31_18G253000 [Glycine max]
MVVENKEYFALSACFCKDRANSSSTSTSPIVGRSSGSNFTHLRVISTKTCQPGAILPSIISSIFSSRGFFRNQQLHLIPIDFKIKFKMILESIVPLSSLRHVGSSLRHMGGIYGEDLKKSHIICLSP